MHCWRGGFKGVAHPGILSDRISGGGNQEAGRQRSAASERFQAFGCFGHGGPGSSIHPGRFRETVLKEKGYGVFKGSLGLLKKQEEILADPIDIHTIGIWDTDRLIGRIRHSALYLYTLLAGSGGHTLDDIYRANPSVRPYDRGEVGADRAQPSCEDL